MALPGRGGVLFINVNNAFMTDHLDKAKRSWNVSRIRGKNTTPVQTVLTQRRDDATRNKNLNIHFIMQP
jgi:hypothetical protein